MLSRLFSQFTLKYGKSTATILAVTLFFSLLGYWKFEEALTKPEMCLSGSGDGLAWIGFIFSVIQEADEKGIGVLFGSTFWSEKLGFDLTAPYPLGVYWKWNFWTLSHFFSAENIYDFNGLLAFVLIGVFGFILLRELEISVFFAVLGALFLTHMDHFSSRLNGHLIGVGSYYVPILLAWGAIRAGKNPSFLRLTILSALNVLSFLVFEYYGYFGVFFSFVLFLGYFLKHGRRNELQWAKFAVRLCTSLLLFVVLMCFCYPNMVFHRIASLFFSGSETSLAVHNKAHGWFYFLSYSVRKPLALFNSSLPLLRELMNGGPFKNDLGEFTFRIGALLPLFILASLLFFGCKYFIWKCREGLEPILECAAWIPPMAVMVFFGLNPEHFFSLVPLTYKIAPMFRVAARAFLYVDIVLIVLFVYMADKLGRLALNNLKGSGTFLSRGFAAFLLFSVFVVTVLGIKDVSGLRLFEKAHAYKLPDISVYSSLKERPEGLVMELPAYSPIADDTGETYIYFYNRTQHGFPIANIWYPLPTNVEFRGRLHKLSQYLNALSPQVILALKKVGVRYVVVNREKIDDSRLRESPHVQLITDTSGKSIFEIKVDKKAYRKDFLEHFVYSEPTLVFRSGFRSEERKKGFYWRWSGGRGVLLLRNHSKHNKKVELSAGFHSPVGSTLEIESSIFHKKIKMKESRVQLRREIDLQGKSSIKITVSSNASPHPGPDKTLVFYMFNYKAKTLE